LPAWSRQLRPEAKLRISDIEIRKVIGVGGFALIEGGEGLEVSPRESDWPLIQELTARVMAMPDRAELATELKARIEAGDYRPASAEIAEAMIRRAIADRIR
jgi:hypothetical protein